MEDLSRTGCRIPIARVTTTNNSRASSSVSQALTRTQLTGPPEGTEQVDQTVRRDDASQAVVVLRRDAPVRSAAVPGEMDQPRFVIEQGLGDVGRAYSQVDADFDVVPVLPDRMVLRISRIPWSSGASRYRGICGEDENLYRKPDGP